MVPNDNAIERVWSKDQKSYFAIIEIMNGAYKIEPYVLMIDTEEDVEYWSGSLNQSHSIFSDTILARKEATRLLKQIGE